ncbi:hypothetical protein nbrc107697_27170 [Gordonia crocea]|uniref:DUF3558 domain-containing protein n=2 Tax=Gordonia crocea TaxID=589162 RepID=A0A7I9UZT1_9ACTN|nr:hypothetical protein nbrc107697_27170 [Gordonia crocea]
MNHLRRIGVAVVAIAAVFSLAGCNGGDNNPLPRGNDPVRPKGHVDTDKYDKVTLECQIVSPAEIGKAIGGAVGSPDFNGAICRWTVYGAMRMTVTFNWFEWGSMSVEQRTAKKLGYETENVKVNGSSAFTQTKAGRNICGVTAKAPSRGIYTWFVEAEGGSSGDTCQSATKLMELVLKNSA